jgi:hypothetical protein
MVLAAHVTAGAFAFTLLSIGVVNAQPTGVTVCDDFLNKWESCLASKASGPQKDALKAQLDAVRKSWAEMQKSVSKPTLESVCRDQGERMKSMLSLLGCTF